MTWYPPPPLQDHLRHPGPWLCYFFDLSPPPPSRTTFYATLARLLFMDDSPLKFKTFVAPINSMLLALTQAASSGVAGLRQPMLKVCGEV